MDSQEKIRDEIDLIKLVKVLIKQKWVIIGGTLIITLLSVIIALVWPRVYKSEGFFQLGRGIEPDLLEMKDIQDEIRKDFHDNLVDDETLQNEMLLNQALQNTDMMMMNVSIPDYKKYASQFTNPQKLSRFIKRNKSIGENEMVDIKKDLQTSEEIQHWIEPVYAYSKRDIKDLAQNSRDLKNFVLGVQVYGEQNTPKKAGNFVTLLGGFIEDSILYGKLRDYINTQLNKNKTESKKYDNIVIGDEFKLQQLSRKLNSLKQIMKKYPESKSLSNRELFAFQLNSQRWLSPITQVVGVESYIADIKENLAQSQRKKQIADLKILFFLELKKEASKEKYGESLLSKCRQFTESFLQREDFPGDVLREVRNDLSVDFDNFATFYEEMQFISGPTISKKPVKPKKALMVAIGFVLGFFISIFLAFFLDWWLTNKRKIMSGMSQG